MRILKERQVSACECAYRLCHLPLRSGSRKCILLNARLPDQRYHVVKFKDDKAIAYCANIFERYEKRPKDDKHKNMCLLEFAMNYEPYYRNRAYEPDEDIDADADTGVPPRRQRRELIVLEDASKMALRNIPAAVRTPYFSVHNDAENYFYSLLVQYVPFNKESELLERYPNSRDAFLDREKKFFGDENPFLSSIRERSNQLENAFRQAQALEILQNLEDYVPEEIPEEEVPVLNMTDEQFRDAQNAMNVQQRELLNIITRGIENQMRGDSSRFLIFVTGGAGVGKTFTFNTLKEKVNKYI
ncbi:ATP-dependent DNA helicase [Nephila pilipes]|uniref:ATP-dependent DNA helicase n=1 Tax=Nephila pilipes TaxID=299642 RepID=A0A8X6TU70_NEPPI|nr:ATP-dependent DNA helicase [Nephila pilipes]